MKIEQLNIPLLLNETTQIDYIHNLDGVSEPSWGVTERVPSNGAFGVNWAFNICSEYIGYIDLYDEVTYEDYVNIEELIEITKRRYPEYLDRLNDYLTYINL